LLFREPVTLFQKGGAGTENGGQRRPEIVGDGPQQVGPHAFLFAFGLDGLLPADLGGKGAGEQGDDDHHHGGEQILPDGEVQHEKGRRKGIVDQQHTDHSG